MVVKLEYSSLQVLPKPGPLMVQVQTLPSGYTMPAERSYQEGSSGMGELSDSLSVGEAVVSNLRRRKNRVGVMLFWVLICFFLVLFSDI